MIGIGWGCDECGKTVVVAGDWFMQQGPGEPPFGWYLVSRTGSETAVRREFCSAECIHAAHTDERAAL